MCVLALEEQTATINLELVVATPNDLKEIDYYKDLGNEEFKPIYKKRYNLPYWLKSFKTNTIESKCYFFNDNTNTHDLKIFLDDNRVFIHDSFRR